MHAQRREILFQRGNRHIDEMLQQRPVTGASGL